MYEWQKYEIKITRTSDSDPTDAVIDGPKSAAEMFHQHAKENDYESLWVMVFNNKNQMIGIQCLASGTASGTSVRGAEVFRLAILLNGIGIVLVHNHPSGSTQESESDITLTRDIAEAAKLLDIELMDHLIVSGTEVNSLRAQYALDADSPWLPLSKGSVIHEA
jgi:DNA repair protein RadC